MDNSELMKYIIGIVLFLGMLLGIYFILNRLGIK